MRWNHFAPAFYSTGDDSEPFVGDHFQFPSGVAQFPASPFFELNPMLVTNDSGMFYDDVWWTTPDGVPG